MDSEGHRFLGGERVRPPKSRIPDGTDISPEEDEDPPFVRVHNQETKELEEPYQKTRIARGSGSTTRNTIISLIIMANRSQNIR